MALPASDDMGENTSYQAEFSRSLQVPNSAYRMYNHRNSKMKQALLLQTQSAFTSECHKKGGTISKRDSRDYALTTERLSSSLQNATTAICIRPDRVALGMLGFVDKGYP